MSEVVQLIYRSVGNSSKHPRRLALAGALAERLGVGLQLGPEALGQVGEGRAVVLVNDEEFEDRGGLRAAQNLLIGIFFSPEKLSKNSEQLLKSYDDFSFYINENCDLAEIEDGLRDLFS